MKYIGLGICIFNFIKCTICVCVCAHGGRYILQQACDRIVVRLIFYVRVKRIIYLAVQYTYTTRAVFFFFLLKNNAPKTFKGRGKINNTNFAKIKLKYHYPVIDTILLLHYCLPGW